MPSGKRHSRTKKNLQKLLASSNRWCAFQSQFCRRRRSAAPWGLPRWGCSGQRSGWWSSRWGRPGRPSTRFLWWASWSSPPASHCHKQTKQHRGTMEGGGNETVVGADNSTWRCLMILKQCVLQARTKRCCNHVNVCHPWSQAAGTCTHIMGGRCVVSSRQPEDDDGIDDEERIARETLHFKSI